MLTYIYLYIFFHIYMQEYHAIKIYLSQTIYRDSNFFRDFGAASYGLSRGRPIKQQPEVLANKNTWLAEGEGAI